MQYRPIHCSFWDDNYVEKLQPMEKLVFIYLLTNKRTTSIGLYELSFGRAAAEIGISVKDFETAIAKLEHDKKLIVDRESCEVLIVNWLGFHPSDGPKIRANMLKEIRKTHSARLVREWVRIAGGYKLELPGDPGNGRAVKPQVSSPLQPREKTKKTKDRPAPDPKVSMLRPAPPADVSAQIEDGPAKREHAVLEELLTTAKPDVAAVARAFYQACDGIGLAPNIDTFDLRRTEEMLGRSSVDRLTNLVRYAVWLSKEKGYALTLHGCYRPLVTNQYNQSWAKKAWEYPDLKDAPVDREWWG